MSLDTLLLNKMDIFFHTFVSMNIVSCSGAVIGR